LLQERLQQDLKDAMRNGQTVRRNVIRFIRSCIHNKEIERQEALTNDGIIEVLGQQIKQRLDSIDAFQKGGRMDLVQKEESELSVIREYMPPQLSEEEIVKIVEATIRRIEASGSKDMGRVMGLVMPELRGRADGRVVSRIVQTILG